MSERTVQLEYSLREPRMLDETRRRHKGAKIIAVLQHFLGVSSFAGLHVLDIGTSAGFIASELARAGGTVLGVDIDIPGVAEAAVRHRDEVSFLNAEGERLPVRDGSMDVVVFNQIYEHVLNPDGVMAEIPARPASRWRRLPRARQSARCGRTTLRPAVPVLAARTAGRPVCPSDGPEQPLPRAVPHPWRTPPHGRGLRCLGLQPVGDRRTGPVRRGRPRSWPASPSPAACITSR